MPTLVLPARGHRRGVAEGYAPHHGTAVVAEGVHTGLGDVRLQVAPRPPLPQPPLPQPPLPEPGDFPDVGAYPALEFHSERFTHRGGSRWAVTGALTLHGVSRTVTLDTR